MSKHYVRTNDKGFVIKYLSDALEKPLENDICVNTNGARQFNLELYREDELYNYKVVNGQLFKTTDADLVIELETMAKDKRVNDILKELASLDFKTIKRLQGHYTDSEWITHVAYCDALRDEMNGLK
jgi:hypothetical protein